MTLMDAREFDEAGARRKKVRIVVIVVTLLVLGFLAYQFRFWPEERLVDKFFAAVQRQDYETAYGLYMADQAWRQHPQQYPLYPYNEFYRDWGPGGQWGTIKTVKVNGASPCPRPSSGVLVDVIVNDRAEHAQVWVENSDHTLGYPPCELIFH